MLSIASAYIPEDRRQAIATGVELSAVDNGAALFVDISGFTPLAETLRRTLGAQRGAEILTRQLNAVYTVLIDQVNDYGGSVIGFSGDAITCWFSGDAASLRAVASAMAIQAGMSAFVAFAVSPGVEAVLAVKAAIAAGPVRRFLVGDPDFQLVDVLAGSTLDRMIALEKIAGPGEIWVDATTAALDPVAPLIVEWRKTEDSGQAARLQRGEPPWHRAADLEQAVLNEGQVRPWVLPAVFQRLTGEHGEFLAELRPATALFLQFGGLDYDHDPEAAKKLDAYVRWVQRILNRYAGSLIQLTTGDKGNYLYAAFGAPIAHDDDPRRAVAAALELRSAPPDNPDIREIHIGVSQGIMRVGPYGSPTRQTYGVLGNETNMAARLMVEAEPGQVLITERLAVGLAGYFDLQPLGLRSIKGRAEPQSIHAVVGVQLDVEGQLAAFHAAPLVGRTTELALLCDAVVDVLAAQGRIARIQGEAGVGKSHLAAHFANWAEAQGLQLHIVACQSTAQSASYQALRPVVRTLVGLTGMERDTNIAQISRLEQVLQERNPDWLLRCPLLGDLLGIEIPDNELTVAMDARLRQESLLSLVVEILEDAARRQPMLLLCEDVHWLDEATQKILLTLARVRPGWLLLLLVHRPPAPDDLFLAAVAGLPDQTAIQLTDLDAEGIGELVRRRLDGDVDLLAQAFIFAQCQGNPFFAEELVDALNERGHLIHDEEGWQLSPALIERLRTANCLARVEERWTLAPNARLASVNLGIPASVHGLVLSRLDRLPEPSKLTLKVAAVIGRVFELEVLAAAHPVDGDMTVLDAHLHLFQERDFARLESPQPTPVYIFKHNITQEAVYQTLLETQQHTLHLAVAQAIEVRQPDAVERLAHHYRNSDLGQPPVRARALHYLETAARRAQHDYANETALAYYDQALGLETRASWIVEEVELFHILGRREEERRLLTVLRTRPDVSVNNVTLLEARYAEAISDYEAARHALTEALSGFERQGDSEGVARVWIQLGEIALRQADVEYAAECYRTALETIRGEHGAERLEADIAFGLGMVLRHQGDFAQSQARFGKALSGYQAVGARAEEAKTLTALGGVAFLRRDFEQALQFSREALTIRRMIGDKEGIGSSLLNVSQVLRAVGDYKGAQPLLEESLAIQQSIENHWWENAIWNELGVLAMETAHWVEARRVFEHALEISGRIGDEGGSAIFLLNLGQVERAQGNLTNAKSNLSKSLSMARQQGDREQQAQCLTELALTYLTDDEWQTAWECAGEALSIYDELNMNLVKTTDLATLALCHLQRRDVSAALQLVDEVLEVLDATGGESIDYPHRDYWVCAQVLDASGEVEKARTLLRKAQASIWARAKNIADLTLRDQFLKYGAFHSVVLESIIASDK